MRDAFQVMRGYRKRREDRLKPMGEMFKHHHYAQELYFARLTAAVINTNAAERSDTVKVKDFLSEDHPARDQMGMTKERLKANYKRFEKNHPEKVPD